MAAVGCLSPGSSSVIETDAFSGMWQSIQFPLIEGPIAAVSLQRWFFGPSWQVIHRWENRAVWPLSILCGSWQVLQVMDALIVKHLLERSRPYWLPCTSTLAGSGSGAGVSRAK